MTTTTTAYYVDYIVQAAATSPRADGDASSVGALPIARKGTVTPQLAGVLSGKQPMIFALEHHRYHLAWVEA